MGDDRARYRVLTDAVRRDPADRDAHLALARHHMAFGRADLAMASLLTVRRLAPDHPKVGDMIAHCLGRLRLPPPVQLYDEILARLTAGDIDDMRIAAVAGRMLARRHGLGPETVPAATPDDATCSALAADPLFRRFLDRCANVHPVIERAMVRLRRRCCLNDGLTADDQGENQREPLPLEARISLAAGLLNSDYAAAWTDDEQVALDARIARVDARAAELGDVALTDDLVAIAMYRMPPMAAMAELATRPALPDPARRRFLAVFHDEPMAITAQRIPALRPVTDPLSLRVRAQYESWPYPRWRGLRPIRRRRLAEVLARTLGTPVTGTPTHAAIAALPDDPDILIAGGGTGRHTIHTARRYQHRSVTAIDLSAASLAYAAHKAGLHGCDDVAMLRADLFDLTSERLEAAGRPGRFHLIEAVGVLHHTADPLAAWRRLRDLLHPGGWMKIGLYSATARRDLLAARLWLARHGWRGDAASMRRFRRDLLDGRLDPALAHLVTCGDFYNLNHLRDLLFHEQEVLFTVPMIAAHLDALGLSFAGLSLPESDVMPRYRAMFPNDPAGANLENWAAFERRNPKTFIEMYHIWCHD